jgi:hypothetical protein
MFNAVGSSLNLINLERLQHLIKSYFVFIIANVFAVSFFIRLQKLVCNLLQFHVTRIINLLMEMRRNNIDSE